MPRIDDRDLYLHNQSLVRVLEDISAGIMAVSRTLVDMKNLLQDQALKADVARELINTALGDVEDD